MGLACFWQTSYSAHRDSPPLMEGTLASSAVARARRQHALRAGRATFAALLLALHGVSPWKNLARVARRFRGSATLIHLVSLSPSSTNTLYLRPVMFARRCNGAAAARKQAKQVWRSSCISPLNCVVAAAWFLKALAYNKQYEQAPPYVIIVV